MLQRLALLCLALLMLSQTSAQDKTPIETLRFRSIGPGAMSGRITAITCDPRDPRIIYAGAASGGVWRSKSGGTAWAPIFDEAPTQSVGALAINPLNPDEIWVGTGEGNPRNSQNFGIGIFKSIDGGTSWSSCGLERTRAIHRIVIHPHDPKTVWVAAMGSAYGPNPERGVYKTTDGGKTWNRVLYINDLTGCADLVLDPTNPNKLVAAMWTYRRWPWTFNSGGPESGLYISHDGGTTWVRRTDKDGLPEGDLGRIGLAIAPSNPAVVYALVEAKENALFKSTDGGRKWIKMADKNMGDRPFYYNEIHVDPQHEHILYSVHSQVTRSIDGGRTFDRWVGFWDIHPDHHAFWINPANPKHIIDGNDGGLNITYDGGETWRYAENIPVGQFYHIDVDDQRPYRVYGGLQDNGSWVGPSAVWKRSGMRNSEWRELYFGDGFDVLPQAGNPRFCYAMSQGGELAEVDIETGKTRYIKPLHPQDVPLRFNWNAALARDPHHPDGIYFGSQYVHHSKDRGLTWEIHSPDLTTNDTSKLKQHLSGGLTPDVTSAENHCTIIAIAPSPVEAGTIWVGTDDGRLQLTRDGGASWSDLAGKLPGCPDNAWIPQIEVSKTRAGEAFVVVNHYRQNDFDPYLYHTTDFGKKWKRLASPKHVQGFCLSVVQDPVEPSLLFLGTDQGLYYSLDYGETWIHWPAKGLPSVPVQDMKIHPRDGDLVLGTFGRAIWILDNLAPLRAMAATKGKIMDKQMALFQPQPAILAQYISYDGARFTAQETYQGDNKPTYASIPIWVKPGAVKDAKKEKADVLIRNMQGDTLRRFRTPLDTFFQTITWGLDTRGVRLPAREKPSKDADEPGGGPTVSPGRYAVQVTYGGHTDSTHLEVLYDPRLDPPSAADMEAKIAGVNAWMASAERSRKAYETLTEAEQTIARIDKNLEAWPDSSKNNAVKAGKALQDTITELKEAFFTHKTLKGIQRNPNTLNGAHYRALQYLNAADGAPTRQARLAMEQLEQEREHIINRINAIIEGPWKDYQKQVEALQFPLFKTIERI